MSNTILGRDAYWMNFFGLMLLTLIEVAAVGADLSSAAEGFSMTERQLTLWILTVIAIPKFIMIAAIFMHLWGENDSGILTLTALFPAFFIIIMVLFIGLTHPDAATGLPDWCRPGNYGL
ncbi:MAG: cytochrome C oxidase subunit IV family protein [Candidatus Thermoplasmatota archaeon]|nr:cytochrome C oxidase subunit IV family protein [Candidatus Thermoplasmatota archaeon]